MGGDLGLLHIVIAVAIGAGIWIGATRIIRILSTPPPEVDPADVVDVDQDYRCSVCGAEVTLRVANLLEAGPPRHCREDMVEVWRPGRHQR